FAMVVELGCWFVTLRKQHSQPTATAFLILPACRRTPDPRLAPLPEALRLAADLAENNARLEHTVQRQAERVAALDQLAAADGSMCVTDAAKALKVPPRSLIAWLDRNAWTYRRSGGVQVAYQALIMRGLLEHVSRTIRLQDGSDKVVSSVRVTSKGLAELARRVAAGAIRSQGGA
ncbi:phage antirepressor KilAC domain-containing protein, partial [Burkholderia anthina]|uniref:phage antirepressor KilAC domain-containing protein n=1 Tax=Burkholderia anthina TaxID=179879 RepID=UPI00158CBD1E